MENLQHGSENPISQALIEKESFRADLKDRLSRNPDRIFVAPMKKGSYKLNEQYFLPTNKVRLVEIYENLAVNRVYSRIYYRQHYQKFRLFV